MLEQLKKEVCEANVLLSKSDLAVLTWGNVSGIDPTRKYIVIKPSGVPYALLTPEDMVVCSVLGRVVEGRLAPSVDLPTHMVLYERFPEISGVCHTHSVFATAFAQAKKEIVPFGTTQADSFYGNIPCTEPLSENEIRHDYTANTGLSIVKRFKDKDVDYRNSPGCLVANHGVFAWGDSAKRSVETAIIIEQCAKMNFVTLQLDPDAQRISQCLLDEHFARKHGPNKTYGQKGDIK